MCKEMLKNVKNWWLNKDFFRKLCYNPIVAAPYTGDGREVHKWYHYTLFFFSVLAGIISGIIVEMIMKLLSKWFGRKKK